MGLEHVVVTSVDRDDLADRGAAHFAQTVRALRRRLPECTIELLTPDFLGFEDEAIEIVLDARPDVFNHNIETVRRIQPKVRPKGDYDRALWLLQRAKQRWSELGHEADTGKPLLTKSGIIVGMGETDDEVVETMRDLRAFDVDVVTIGQYLQPTEKHLPLARWVDLDTFRRFRAEGEAMGSARCSPGRSCARPTAPTSSAPRPPARSAPFRCSRLGGARSPIGHASRGQWPLSRLARPGAGLLAGVLALGDLLDELAAERRQVVRFSARHQALVDVHLLIDPGSAGVADVGLQATATT